MKRCRLCRWPYSVEFSHGCWHEPVIVTPLPCAHHVPETPTKFDFSAPRPSDCKVQCTMCGRWMYAQQLGTPAQ